jgi:hypothetical protein
MTNRVEIFKNGERISLVDRRDFLLEQKYRLEVWRASISEAILTRFPVYKQNNAALGILTETESEAIREGIISLRKIHDDHSEAIQSRTSLKDLDDLLDPVLV